MMQTVEAVIDEKGNIRLVESIDLKETRRALVTLLPNKTTDKTLAGSLANLGEILDDDLESSSRDISAKFRDSINRSAEELGN